MKRIPVLCVAAAFLSIPACSTQDAPSTAIENPSGRVADSGDPGDSAVPSPGDAGTTPSDDGSTGQNGGDPPSPSSKVHVTNETISSGGAIRSYVLVVPTAYDATRTYPLVLVLHGDYGDGPSMRASYTLDDYTGDDAIVAYPTGTYDATGMCTWDLSLDVPSNYDMTFLSNLVDALKGQYNIDSNRIFGAGYSKGGFMVNFVACVMPLFRAIAVSEGGMAYGVDDGPPNCTAGPMAAFIMHDPEDPVVDVSSGKWDAEYWAEQAQCTDAHNQDGNLILPSTQVDPPQCSTYNGCDPNSPVELCLIPGIGHVPWWPEGAEATWAFFQNFH